MRHETSELTMEVLFGLGLRVIPGKDEEMNVISSMVMCLHVLLTKDTNTTNVVFVVGALPRRHGVFQNNWL